MSLEGEHFGSPFLFDFQYILKPIFSNMGSKKEYVGLNNVLLYLILYLKKLVCTSNFLIERENEYFI